MMLSVVIVNWNTGDLLRQCLESVYCAAPGLELEVIVVDNASADGSAQAAQDSFSQTKFIQNRSNPGFGAANNQAMRQAQGDLFLLLNPDTWVHPGALQAMRQFLTEHPEAGAVGPMLLNSDGTLQYSCSPQPTLRTEILRLFHLGKMRPDGYYPMETWDQQAPRPVDILMGACVLARREAMEQVGLFDEDYFMYSEEVDLFYKLHQAGWSVWWTPQAKVTHHGGQSTRLAAAEMFLQLYSAKIAYFRRHHGAAVALAYKLVLVIAGVVRIIAGTAARLLSRGDRSRTTLLVQNYRRLLARLPGM